MAGDELYAIRLKNDFYKDGAYKIYLALLVALGAFAAICFTCVFLLLSKPRPVVFPVDQEFRIFPPVPVAQPYISEADLLQWISTVIPQAFTYDFINYQTQLNSVKPYFSETGFSKLNDLLNNYINPTTIANTKTYVAANAVSAPIILKKNLLDGRYSWWVELSINLFFSNGEKTSNTPLLLNILVTRISTINDLLGVTIDNILVVKNSGSKAAI